MSEFRLDSLYNDAALMIDTTANIGYGLLLQEMARISSYFCEEAVVGRLVDVLLVTVNSYQNLLTNEVIKKVIVNSCQFYKSAYIIIFNKGFDF